MNINFCTIANATMASYRYHIQIPARELSKLGHNVTIGDLDNNADVVIFNKHFNYDDHETLLECRRNGVKTAFHCCDNHFETKHREHYRKMLRDADKILAPTEGMARIIRSEMGREAIVIPDPYEMAEKKPAFKTEGEQLRLLWFGHHSNIDSLLEAWPVLQGHFIAVMTDPSVTINGKPVIPWSIEKLEEVLEKTDVVVIPSKQNDRKTVKSPNRLIEAVRQGKFVVSDPIPSYEPFSHWMCVSGIKEGLQWVKDNPDKIEDRISGAQVYIKREHSPERVGKLWEAALRS